MTRCVLSMTGCSSYSVTTGTASEHEDHIAEAEDVRGEHRKLYSSCNGTDLQTLCDISRMINLTHMRCGESDLVSV